MFADLHWMPDLLHSGEEHTLHTMENWVKMGETVKTGSQEKWNAAKLKWEEIKQDTADYYETFQLWQTWGSIIMWMTWLYWLVSSALITRFLWQYYRYFKNRSMPPPRSPRPSIGSVLSLAVPPPTIWTRRTWLIWGVWMTGVNILNWKMWSSWMNWVAWILWLGTAGFLTWFHHGT